jgi:hypothetical protein
MPIFQAKARSWQAYLAGFGASGALMAGAFVVSVGLIGVITFNTWPHTGDRLGRADGGDVLNDSAASSPPPAQHRGTLNLAGLPGVGPGQATRQQVGGSGPLPAVNGGLPGSNLAPGGSGGAPTPVEPPQPPPPPTQPPSVVSQVVSGAGNTVQSTTDTLGNALGGSDTPGLGGVVGGVGRTLNNDLQSIAGNP